MLTFGKNMLPKRSLALALALTMICPPISGLMVSAQAQDSPPPAPQVAPAPPSSPPGGSTIRIPMAPVEAGPIHTILLFPFANAISASGNTGGFNPDIVGARVEDAVKMRLNVIGRYKANSFSPALPQIQRALQEARVEGLSENDLVPPYTDSPKAQKIATQVGTDGYLLGTIEALRVDPATRNVSVTVSATLYNTATGGTAKVLAYTGKGVSYSATDEPDNLLQSAINDAAGHIVSALNAGAPEEHRNLAPVDYKRGRRSQNGSILLGILLAAAVGIAIGSSHHGGGSTIVSGGTTGGTTDTGGPPPVPTQLGSGNDSSQPPAAPNP